MRPVTRFLVAILVLVAGSSTVADEHKMQHQHITATGDDARQAVSFPPMMRTHLLSNMRDHLGALSEILSAMASADYTEAALVANTRLGLGSPAAAGCEYEPASPANASPVVAARMEEMMFRHMPADMRSIGLAMHQAASSFGKEARKAAKSGDATPAYRALADVTRQCVACHAAYRLE